MNTKGYSEYKRREFCKDTQCPRQLELNKQTEGSPEYEKTRKKCSTECLYTTWQFHHWLIEKGYIIIVDSQLKNNQETILANINKDLILWIDNQIKAGYYSNREQVIETAITKLKQNEK